jgi:hypothetical protein
MLGAFSKDFRREEVIDPEELEFHRIAAGFRCDINEFQGAGKFAAVVGRGFGDENRTVHAENRSLTVSKAPLAKRALTSGVPDPCARESRQSGRR